MIGKSTFCIKIYDGTIRELKDVRYILRMMKNLISIGDLEVEGLRETLEEDILKMSSGPLVILKGIRCNKVYCLMDSAVTGLVSSEQLDGDSTRLWHKGFGQVSLS